jgi:hypothetical protein
MVVGYALDEILGETGLTGLVEADLSSEAAIGDPRIAESYELLDVGVQGTT